MNILVRSFFSFLIVMTFTPFEDSSAGGLDISLIKECNMGYFGSDLSYAIDKELKEVIDCNIPDEYKYYELHPNLKSKMASMCTKQKEACKRYFDSQLESSITPEKAEADALYAKCHLDLYEEVQSFMNSITKGGSKVDFTIGNNNKVYSCEVKNRNWDLALKKKIREANDVLKFVESGNPYKYCHMMTSQVVFPKQGSRCGGEPTCLATVYCSKKKVTGLMQCSANEQGKCPSVSECAAAPAGNLIDNEQTAASHIVDENLKTKMKN